MMLYAPRETEKPDFSYYSIDAAEFLWGYAISDDVTLTVTPEGV